MYRVEILDNGKAGIVGPNFEIGMESCWPVADAEVLVSALNSAFNAGFDCLLNDMAAKGKV